MMRSYEAIVSAIDAFDPAREEAGSTVDNWQSPRWATICVFDGLVHHAGKESFSRAKTSLKSWGRALFLADQAG